MDSVLDILHMRKLFRHTHDPIWQLQLGVVVVMLMQFYTNDTFLPYNKFLILIFEAVLLVALVIVTSDGYHRVSRSRRTLAITLIGIVAVINIFSLIFLVRALLDGGINGVSGVQLLSNGFVIYLTNILMFAMLYWELDGGGPDRRVNDERRRDFLFPQMIHHEFAGIGWLPGFLDYLYISVTNVTNFAAADTLPLSHKAKMLMMIQALVSVVTVVLVAARAIGVLH